MEKLTKENYRTNHDYMSYSRFTRFLSCEAKAVSDYREPSTESQLVGSYVDSHFSGELEEFKAEHPEIINSKTGELKAAYKKADDIIARIESDETFMHYMSGEKQRIMSGEIDGIPFKIKMDSYKEDEFIVDLKVIKDFEKVWSTAHNSYQNFAIAYNYDIELAIFQEIVFQNTGKKLPCYLACITKEEPSNLNILSLPQSILDEALTIVKHNLPHIKQILNGEINPCRCEKCAYCRLTKKAKVLDLEYADFDGNQLFEEGIECIDPKLNKTEIN